MLSSKKLKPHLKASGLIQRYKDIILSEPQKFVHRRFDDCIEDLLGQ